MQFNFALAKLNNDRKDEVTDTVNVYCVCVCVRSDEGD